MRHRQNAKGAILYGLPVNSFGKMFQRIFILCASINDRFSVIRYKNKNFLYIR